MKLCQDIIKERIFDVEGRLQARTLNFLFQEQK
jgi:hypothetical protein